MISWLFIAVGCIASLAILSPLFGSTVNLTSHDFFDLTMALSVNVLAIICGIFILFGHNWARWVIVPWMCFHIIISLNSPPKLIAHGVIFSIILYFLFRPKTSGYFMRGKTEPA